MCTKMESPRIVIEQFTPKRIQIQAPSEDEEELQRLTDDPGVNTSNEEEDKIKEITLFVDEVLETARIEAEKRKSAMEADQKKRLQQRFTSHFSFDNNLLTGLKQTRIVNRARTAVLRLFGTICNCNNNTNPRAGVPGGSIGSSSVGGGAGTTSK